MAGSKKQAGKQGRSGNPAARAAQGQAAPGPSKPGQTKPGQAKPKSSTKSAAAKASPTSPRASVPSTPVDLPKLPHNGVAYPQILRTDGYAPWRSIVGVLLGLSMFILLTNLISQLVVFISWSLFASDRLYRDYFTSAFAFERPSGMLAANLGIATLIPVACVLMVVLHKLQPAWLLSVQAKVRWPYFWACLVAALVASSGTVLLSTLGHDLSVQPGFWGFLIVILLTSPIQAAAEEVFFRGYLLQALGSLFAQPWFGIVLSAGVFAFFHGTQNLPLFLDRFAFGLLAAVLVWRTGGIEAGVAAHIVNNVFAYVVAGLTTSIAAVKAIREIGWLDAVVDVGGFAVFAALALLVAAKLKPANRVELSSAAST